MKCDLHRHLSGSISCPTVSQLSNMPIEKVVKLMTYSDDDENDYKSFFKKFDIFNKIEWTRHKIKHSIKDVIWQLKQEKLDYAEIKFSINKYIPYIDMDIKDTILWFANCFDEIGAHWGIEIDLILSLKHDMNKNVQIALGNTIENDLIAECIAGIDIVGDETYFDVDFYKPIFEKWHKSNKICMAHVGEINKPSNVVNAINKLNLDRVCHGLASADNKDLAKLCRDRLIPFDICLTSNIKTGIVSDINNHPILKMLDNGFIITIGTDDPSVFGTNYNKEVELFKKICKLNNEESDTILNSSYMFSAREIIKRKQK